jgi:phage FluMu gp28-like protein
MKGLNGCEKMSTGFLMLTRWTMPIGILLIDYSPLLKERGFTEFSMRQIVKLLDYQAAAIQDKSRFKVLMWARGARKTFTVTLEIINDCFAQEASGRRTTWVILSRGERQAREAMEECKRHASVYMWGCDIETGTFKSENGKRQFTQLEIRFPGGSRILALPANPDTARGYSANIFLDEFCIHEQDTEIWRAMQPVLRGRYRVIVSSTPKGGRDRKFYQIINNQEPGLWSKHIVDIYQAVAAGLPFDIELERKVMGDPDGWAQEMELQWLDEASSWLPYELIGTCEDPTADDAGGGYQGGLCYIGNDIAARHDLWVAWVLEKVGDIVWTREVVALRRATFAEQDAAIRMLFEKYKVARMCVDQTGMGERAVIDYQSWFGSTRVEGLLFTATSKQGLATIGRQAFENRTVRIPDRPEIRSDLYKLKRTVTLAGNTRFDAARDDNGHADRAWALFLALNAADQGAVPLELESVPRAGTSFDGYGSGRRTSFKGF